MKQLLFNPVTHVFNVPAIREETDKVVLFLKDILDNNKMPWRVVHSHPFNPDEQGATSSVSYIYTDGESETVLLHSFHKDGSRIEVIQNGLCYMPDYFATEPHELYDQIVAMTCAASSSNPPEVGNGLLSEKTPYEERPTVVLDIPTDLVVLGL